MLQLITVVGLSLDLLYMIGALEFDLGLVRGLGHDPTLWMRSRSSRAQNLSPLESPAASTSKVRTTDSRENGAGKTALSKGCTLLFGRCAQGDRFPIGGAGTWTFE
jgi:hypothetical protein